MTRSRTCSTNAQTFMASVFWEICMTIYSSPKQALLIDIHSVAQSGIYTEMLPILIADPTCCPLWIKKFRRRHTDPNIKTLILLRDGTKSSVNKMSFLCSLTPAASSQLLAGMDTLKFNRSHGYFGSSAEATWSHTLCLSRRRLPSEQIPLLARLAIG